MSASFEDALVGCLWGTAVGDAVGLACEGYPKARQRRVFGEIVGPRFFCGRGLVSDDTEHACLCAQALVACGGDERAFAAALSREMKRWFAALPAGLGAATFKACARLCAGVAPSRSGVFSAGNGPAMRAPILGVAAAGMQANAEVSREDTARLIAWNRIASRITHTDPRAEAGALAIAVAARHFATEKGKVSASKYFDALTLTIGAAELAVASNELLPLIQKALDAARSDQNSVEFAIGLGLERGVSGFILHTVPVALHAAFRYPDDLRAAVLDLVRCGGDTDSTAALAAALIGARVGQNGVPRDWLDALIEWPRDIAWMEKLGLHLAHSMITQAPAAPLRVPPGAAVGRNLLFWLIVWPHVGRRLLPPY